MQKGRASIETARTEQKGFPERSRPLKKKESVAEMVYEFLKDAIVNGDLKPGQRLVEERIAAKMQVSRMPVREAIKRLEYLGFLQRLPVRGVMVKMMSDEDIREVFDVRATLEGYAANLACGHVTEGLLSALRENLDSSMQALRNGDLKGVTDLNEQFDEMIYKAAGSNVLCKLIDTLLDHMAWLRKPRLRSKGDAYVNLKSRTAMIEAIVRRDREKAQWIMESHVLQCRNLVLKSETGPQGVRL